MKNKLSNKIFNIIGLISIILAVVFMLTTTADSNNSMVHYAIEYQKAAPLVGFVITLITLLGGIFVTVLSVIGKAHKYDWIESMFLAALFIYFLAIVLGDKNNDFFRNGFHESTSKAIMCIGIGSVCYGVGALI